MILKKNKKITPKQKTGKKNSKKTFKNQYFAYYNDIKTTPKQDW